MDKPIRRLKTSRTLTYGHLAKVKDLDVFIKEKIKKFIKDNPDLTVYHITERVSQVKSYDIDDLNEYNPNLFNGRKRTLKIKFYCFWNKDKGGRE